jgi:hypothetical protein
LLAVRRRIPEWDLSPTVRAVQAIVPAGDRGEIDAMMKRIAAAVLWFYAGWVAGAMLAFVLGISVALAPIVAVTAAALVAGDPRRLIWFKTRSETATRFAPTAA